ncbi:uncharacterized protein H6S33_012513 [Morchella sextelata]|uniref:uncharacterized protein n=1 Tax=Morchella sextelata TaxID=1174677 RepID=UPI001D0597E7|nr:uncharacterized protein H6S33_012513 [Morchella sextelata]KAH0609967.1 hypothetical protein H6S33_012513 [Morchella sextelata]
MPVTAAVRVNQLQNTFLERLYAAATSANSAIPQGAAPTPWAPGTPGAAKAECSCQASPGQGPHARRRHSRVLTPGVATAGCSRQASPQQGARARRRHSRVLAPGVATAGCSRQASPQQGARARRRHSRVLAPGDPSIRARRPQSSMFSVWQHQGA